MWSFTNSSCLHPPLFQPITKQKHKWREAKRVLTDLMTWLEA